ncbi:hypothetical protein, partial [Actinomyces urogenitalis]
MSTTQSAPSSASQTTLSLTSLPANQVQAQTIVLAAVREAGTSPRARVLTDGVDTSGLDVEALEQTLSALGYTAGLDEVVRLHSRGLGEVTAATLLVVGTGTDLELAAQADADAVALGG